MLEHLKNRTRGNYGPGQCKFARLLERLDETDRNILLDCMEDRDNYSSHGIWQGLRAAGVQIGATSVNRHRDGMCPCGDHNA